jgi:hypothetical protein
MTINMLTGNDGSLQTAEKGYLTIAGQKNLDLLGYYIKDRVFCSIIF